MAAEIREARTTGADEAFESVYHILELFVDGGARFGEASVSECFFFFIFSTDFWPVS